MANFKDNAAARQHQAALKSLFSSLIGAGELVNVMKAEFVEHACDETAKTRAVVDDDDRPRNKFRQLRHGAPSTVAQPE